jgi:hypothetical protein
MRRPGRRRAAAHGPDAGLRAAGRCVGQRRPAGRGTGTRCDRLVELVTDYLEDALDDAAVAELEAHLPRCPGCAAYLDGMRQTVRTLGRVSLDGLSDEARARVLRAFEDMLG